MNKGWEPTNAAMMVIETEEFGYFGIDPLGDTWIDATTTRDLWAGQRGIPTLRSRFPDGKHEIWFVSLDWLITLHPDTPWLHTARDVLRTRGFEADLAFPYDPDDVPR